MKTKNRKDKQILQDLEKKTNSISVLWFLFFSSACSLISYFNRKASPSSLLLFQNPLNLIADLSLVGFLISGLLVGMGVFLCKGGLLYHLLCGIPSLAKESFLIVFLFMLFLVLTELTKEKTMSWMFKTETFYVEHVNDHLYFSIGFMVFVFIILLIMCMVLILDSRTLRMLYDEKRGKVF